MPADERDDQDDDEDSANSSEAGMLPRSSLLASFRPRLTTEDGIKSQAMGSEEPGGEGDLHLSEATANVTAATTKVARSVAKPQDACANFAKNMTSLANKLNNQVASLYKTSRSQGDLKDPSGMETPHKSQDSVAGDDTDEEPAGDKSGTGGGEEEEEEEEEEYDFRSAAHRVGFLLDNLKSDKRTEVMESLEDWYLKRLETIEAEQGELITLEDDEASREKDMKDSLKLLLQGLEEKQMREVKVLSQCNDTLHAGASGSLRNKGRKDIDTDALNFSQQLDKGKKSRQKFSKQDKDKAVRRTQPLESPSNKGKAKAAAKKGDKKPKSEGEAGKAKKTRKKTPRSEGDTLLESVADGEDEAHSEGENSENDEGEEGDEGDGDYLSEAQGRDGEDDDYEGSEDRPPTAAADRWAALSEAFDVDKARHILKNMQEAPKKVLNREDALPSDILGVLALVQDGQRRLEEQSTLAKKHCEVIKSAVEHLTSSNRGEVDEAVTELIQVVKKEVFGAQKSGTMGPDPEALEQEVHDLEKKLESRKREIEEFQKSQERKKKLATAVMNIREQDEREAAMARLMAEEEEIERRASAEPEEDEEDDGDDPPIPKAKQSQILDARDTSTLSASESARVFGTSKDPKARASALANMGPKPAQPTSPTAGSGLKEELLSSRHVSASVVGGAMGLDSDPRVQAMKARIAEKDKKILQAKKLLHRMRSEYRLLQWCQTKAEGGFESLVTNFNPPIIRNFDPDAPDWPDYMDHISDGLFGKDEADGRSDNDGKTDGKKGARGKAARTKVQKDVQAVTQKIPSLEEVLAERAAEMAEAVALEEANRAREGSSASATSTAMAGSGSGGLIMAPSLSFAGSFDASKAEEDVSSQLQALQDNVAQTGEKIREEKLRQKELKKEVGELKKRYKAMTRNDRAAPTTLEGFLKQEEFLTASEDKMKVEIKELQQELINQTRVLSKLQAEVSNRGEDPQQVLASASSPRKSMASTGSSISNRASVAVTASATGAQARGSAGGSNLLTPAAGPAGAGGLAAPAPANTAEEQRQQQRSTGPGLGASVASALGARAGGATAAVAAAVGGGGGGGKGGGGGVAGGGVAAGGVAAVSAAAGGRATAGSGGAGQLSLGLAQAGQSTDPARPAAAGSISPTSPRNAGTGKGADGRISEQTAAAAAATAAANPIIAAAAAALSVPAGRPTTSNTPAAGSGAGASLAPPAPVGPSQGGSRAGSRAGSHAPSSAGSINPQNTAQEEFMQLVKIQSKNEAIKADIDDMITKVQTLRKLMKQGKATHMTREQLRHALGMPDDSEKLKPPPEYFALKKEVRLKQNEVRSLRKRWWDDHKEFDIIVEKARRHLLMAQNDTERAKRQSGLFGNGPIFTGPPTGLGGQKFMEVIEAASKGVLHSGIWKTEGGVAASLFGRPEGGGGGDTGLGVMGSGVKGLEGSSKWGALQGRLRARVGGPTVPTDDPSSLALGGNRIASPHSVGSDDGSNGNANLAMVSGSHIATTRPSTAVAATAAGGAEGGGGPRNRFAALRAAMAMSRKPDAPSTLDFSVQGSHL